jgi:glyceraldehyde 3-phosphate dehydrogenase
VLAACDSYPGLVTTVTDPIVSSDVIGNRHSAVFDLKGTLKSGKRMIKSLVWYESLGHACRTLDVVRLYRALDNKELV